MHLDAQTALHKLTRPWTDVVQVSGRYRPVDHEPLLDMLDGLIRSGLGGSMHGATPPGERSIMNLDAFTLRERIQDGAGAVWVSLSKRPVPRSMAALLDGIEGMVDAAEASGQVSALDASRIGFNLIRWADQVWRLVDPPRVKELDGDCPHCGRDRTDAGEKTLTASYRKGEFPSASCRFCGHRWDGVRACVELGYHIKATIDWETLRAAGVS